VQCGDWIPMFLLKTSNHTSRTSMGRQQCDGYISLTIGLKCMHFNPEDRGRTASETVSNHHTTWHSNLEDQKFYLHRRENLKSSSRIRL